MDIAPELYKKIDEIYRSGVAKDERLKHLLSLKEKGTATLTQARELARLYGNHLSIAFQRVIVAEELPEATLFYNIADKVVRPFLEENAATIGDFTETVIAGINKNAGIGLKPVHAENVAEKIDGIVQRVASQPYEEISWILDEPVVDNAINVVNETIKRNAEFHYRAGIKGHIVRKLAPDECCAWCKALAGSYEYPGVPNEVYMRHDRCDCSVDYVLNSGEIRNMRKSGHAFVRG